MSKRLWLLGMGVLVLMGLLVACGTTYNSSSDGLVLVGSQGSGLIETFSFNLNNGHVATVANSPNDTSSKVCVLNGIPTSLVLNPSGTYAYTIINQNSSCPNSKTGIAVFKVNSDGSITASGSLVPFKQAKVTVVGVAETVSVVPGSMVIDSAGKFVFVADRATADQNKVAVPGAVSVFAVGSGGNLTEVSGSPYVVTPTLAGLNVDIVSVAATPTVLPPYGLGINGIQNTVCSSPGNNPPTAEYLYAVDTLGNQVFEYKVNTTSGVLTAVTGASPGFEAPFPTDAIPAGISVDPCDRFVYVSGSLNNRISAYTICNGLATQDSSCTHTPLPGGSLVQVAGSPFSLTGSANGAGPLVVDPFGNYVYVVGTLSNTVSPLKISPVSGALTAGLPVVTGLQPTSIAIRADDTWLFVTDYNAATVSQYSITPTTGVLSGQPAIQTDNYPWGVAVK